MPFLPFCVLIVNDAKMYSAKWVMDLESVVIRFCASLSVLRVRSKQPIYLSLY